MQGLVVRAQSVPLGVFLELIELKEVDTKNITAEDAAKVDRLFTGFADALVSWNLENEDGSPVPATADGLKSQDIDFVMQIVSAWIAALSQVPDFLVNKSSDGGKSLEQSIPMETSSPSPMN